MAAPTEEEDPTKTVVVEKKAVAKELLAEINRFAEGLKYDGFSTVRTRDNVLKMKVCTKANMARLLIVGSMIGNNFERLTGKIQDKNIAKEATNLIKMFGLSMDPDDKDTLTLPRVMTAFAPLTYLIRRYISKKLQDQSFGTTCSPALQTPSLSCYSDAFPVMKDWLNRFAIAVKPKNQSEQDAIERAEMYRLIAVSNLKIDTKLAFPKAEETIENMFDRFGIKGDDLKMDQTAG